MCHVPLTRQMLAGYFDETMKACDINYLTLRPCEVKRRENNTSEHREKVRVASLTQGKNVNSEPQLLVKRERERRKSFPCQSRIEKVTRGIHFQLTS